MLIMTKPEALTTAVHVSSEVERKLEPLAYEIERSDNRVTYKISWFAPWIAYSMFLPFSEVSLTRENGTWVLRMTPTKLMLLPFAPVALALIVFWASSPIGIIGVAACIGAPTAVVLLAFIEARLRLAAWWSAL